MMTSEEEVEKREKILEEEIEKRGKILEKEIEKRGKILEKEVEKKAEEMMTSKEGIKKEEEMMALKEEIPQLFIRIDQEKHNQKREVFNLEKTGIKARTIGL